MAVTTAVASFDLNQSTWQFSDKRLLQVPAVITPTLDLAQQSQTQGNGLQFFWQQSNRKSSSVVQVDVLAAGTSIEIAAGEAVLFAVGDVLQGINGTTGVPLTDYILVTAVNVGANTLTVQRAHAGTGTPAPVTISAGWTIRRLYSSQSSDSVVYTPTRALWIQESNYFQRIFRKRTITEDFERLKAFEGTQFQHEVMVATAEVVEDLYRAISIGKALISTDKPQGSVSNFPAMNGFHTAWFNAKGFAASTWPDGIPDSTTVTTFDSLLTFLMQKSYARNKGHDLLIFGTAAIRKFFSLGENIGANSGGANFMRALEMSCSCKDCKNAGQTYLGKLATPYGTYKIQVNEYVNSDYIYAMQSTDIALVVAEPVQMTLLSKPDNGTAFRVGGIFSLRYTDPTLWAVAKI